MEQVVTKNGYDFFPLYTHQYKVNSIILQSILSDKDLTIIILSDILNYLYCQDSYGLTMANLYGFRGKIGGFDLYQLSVLSRKMDTYGFKNKMVSYKDLRIDFTILPSPILPVTSGDNSKHSFSAALSDDTSIRSEQQMAVAKKELGISKNDKVVLTTYAAWQNSYKQYKRTTAFVESSEAAFRKLLLRLSSEYVVFCVGKETDEKSHGITYLKQLPPDQFERFLSATDVLIGRNAISTTFANAVMRGIGAVLLINSHDTDCHYKCKMYPVGWHDFLRPVEESNLYFDLFPQLEMFDLETCYTEIVNLIGKKKDYEKIEEYNAALKSLTKPKEIISIMQNLM
jgi:hypothetical protein